MSETYIAFHLEIIYGAIKECAQKATIKELLTEVSTI